MSNYRGNVLVVDDEPRVVRALDRLLKPLYETHLAERGKLALDIVRSRRIDVIVSDQRMPEMAGVELLSKVKLISPHTTRILLTGYSDLSAVMASVNEGEIFRYITKPWRSEELLEAVEKASRIAHSLYGRDVRRINGKDKKKAGNDNKQGDGKEKVLLLDDGSELHEAIYRSLGGRIECLPADNLRDASKLLAENVVNVIVVDMYLGDIESLAFIKTAKSVKPSVLCLVVADTADSEHIMSLINEGQIYRFLKKPLRSGQLKMYLTSAIRYGRQLRECPELLARHIVESIANEEERNFARTFKVYWGSMVKALRRIAV